MYCRVRHEWGGSKLAGSVGRGLPRPLSPRSGPPGGRRSVSGVRRRLARFTRSRMRPDSGQRSRPTAAPSRRSSSRKNTGPCASTGVAACPRPRRPRSKRPSIWRRPAARAPAKSAAARAVCTTAAAGSRTACPEHARGEPVPVKVGCENLHVVRRLVDGGVRIVSCRRYDRNADAFVDVDPHSLGIEE